jgi:hypothetical protein
MLAVEGMSKSEMTYISYSIAGLLELDQLFRGDDRHGGVLEWTRC